MAEDREKVLANIAKFYREALRRDKVGRKLARTLGLHDDQVLERFQVGYANGTLARAIPSKGGVRDALRDLGLLTPEGKEAAEGCLILPVLNRQEHVIGLLALGPDRAERRFPAAVPLYGLSLDALQGEAVHFVGTALDMLLYAQAGLSALAVSPQLADEERALIERHRPAKAYLGGELPELLRFLQRLEVPCYRLSLALPASAAQVEAALSSAEPIGASLGPDAVVRVQDDALRFECGGRRYELRELAPGEEDRLRVRLRAVNCAAFHLDTLDLYAGRSRASFARSAAPLLGVSEPAVEGDLALMIRKLEAIRAARNAKASAPKERYVMTPDEEAEALGFLKAPDLLGRIVQDLEALGYVGEEANKRLGYLITISRKLDSPLCGVIISRAAAGKSRLMEVLAELVPPEDLVSYTRITPQALYYAQNRSLKNKLLVSGEEEGLMGSDYALRELISSKRIRLAAPVKDPIAGKMKTVEYEVEGPISLFFSTTQPAIHYENATRCFVLTLDESPEQTARVMKFQLGKKSLDGLLRSLEARELKRLHRNAQRLLRPLRVVIPEAELLNLPPNRIESRREHEKYLSLIEAVALLHQHQREVKRVPGDGREVEFIEATSADILEANRLMAEVVGEDDAELSGPSEKLLSEIRRMVDERAKALEIDPRAYQFNRRDIREYIGWSDNQIKAHIKRLEDLELLTVKAGERGRMYRYQLGSWQQVGEKLGEGSAPVPDGARPRSWEVGPNRGNGHKGAHKAEAAHV